MKFNLKNRLKKPTDYIEYFNSTEKWFEGFEQELRENIETLEKNLGSEAWRTIVKLREVLGDD